MCAPVPVLLTAATVATQAYGAYSGAQAANAQGKSNQNYYDYVAGQNRTAADYALKTGDARANASQVQGALDTAKYVREASSFGATQRATSAAAGVGGGSVTAEDIGYDTLTKQKLDEMAIRYNADVASYSAKQGAAYEAYDQNNQAILNTMAGKNARAAGKASAKASLIQGATAIANTGMTYNMYKVK